MKVRTLTVLCLLGSLVGCNEVGKKTLNPIDQVTEGAQPESDSIRSSMHREKGAAVLTYAEEITKTITNDLPEVSYRRVPDMEKDDEGTDGANVSTRTALGRPQVTCGAAGTFSGVAARIQDCLQKNGDKATWNGSNNGSSGEGTWQLVARLDNTKEIWMDARTGMVWSDIMNNGDLVSEFNWCKASGSEASATATATVDCNTLAAGESVCVNAVLDDIGDQIQWRLPTRNDFLQADIDGARFVLERAGTNGLWTATLKAGVAGRNEAWVYQTSNGTLMSGELSTTRQVRCIGAPKL